MSAASRWLGIWLFSAMGFSSIFGVRAADSALLDIERRVGHGFATNNAVRIHYAALGQGPLVVMIHGFPDCWLTWRHVMEALAKDYEVVALDQRGYNLSDKPKGVEQYDMAVLVEDVAAVVRARGRERAIIAGHDWGGAVAWNFAMKRPEMTEKLTILNLPHPRGVGRELARNPQQQKASAYARRFQQEGAHANLTAERLAFWVTDAKAKARYVEAFRRSDFEAMLNYYKRRHIAGSEGEVSGADDSRVEGHRPVVAGIERQLGFCGEGFHTGDNPGRRTLRATRRSGAGDPQHPCLALALRGRSAAFQPNHQPRFDPPEEG